MKPNKGPKVWVSGACGYVGSWLVPRLLAKDYNVVAFDTQWFGNGFLPKENPSLEFVKADLRDEPAVLRSMQGCEYVLHLGCLSNDVSCQLDEVLSRDINIHSFDGVVQAAKKAGVRRFIYCSSSSVYGINDSPNVTEDCPLVPVTLYNESKMECEKKLWPHHSDDFTCVAIRPATVCGPAPRMRFDLTVNIMTMHAVMKREITVFGGSQKRPNLHINDMCRVYELMLEAPKDKIAGEVFNVGRQNMKVIEIAGLIKEVVEREIPGNPVTVTVKEHMDNRSYHVNSDKIKRVLGFEPLYSVEDAIRDICIQFKSGMWKDALTNPVYTNVLQYVEKYGMGRKVA